MIPLLHCIHKFITIHSQIVEFTLEELLTEEFIIEDIIQTFLQICEFNTNIICYKRQ